MDMASGSVDYSVGAMVDEQGRTYVCGVVQSMRFALRLTPTGGLDDTFGNSGLIVGKDDPMGQYLRPGRYDLCHGRGLSVPDARGRHSRRLVLRLRLQRANQVLRAASPLGLSATSGPGHEGGRRADCVDVDGVQPARQAVRFAKQQHWQLSRV